MHVFFFDRASVHFRLIWGHLDAITLPHVKRYLFELMTEARFYALQGLQDIILGRLQQMTKHISLRNLDAITLPHEERNLFDIYNVHSPRPRRLWPSSESQKKKIKAEWHRKD